jgi:hypothetical protein
MDAPPYSAYGHYCSTNFEWTWCPRSSRRQAVDIRIELGSLGRFSAFKDSDYSPYRLRPARDPGLPDSVRIDRGPDGHFRVTYGDGAQFAVDAGASEIYGVASGDLTLDDLVVYLQSPILGFVLRLRGVTCLHASAAASGGRAFAMVGDAGMGKSTSAAMFARLGLDVLTDDLLALADGRTTFYAQPGLPRVLLWPDSVANLFGSAEALPRIIGTWDKRYLSLSLPGYHFAGVPAPLEAIYVLGERLEKGKPTEIRELKGSEGLVQLLANTYANDFLTTDLRARELEVLARMIAYVPIRLVRAPNAPPAVESVCRAVIADFQSLS